MNNSLSQTPVRTYSARCVERGTTTARNRAVTSPPTDRTSCSCTARIFMTMWKSHQVSPSLTVWLTVAYPPATATRSIDTSTARGPAAATHSYATR